jgi:CheY-like chemotaxis protein
VETDKRHILYLEDHDDSRTFTTFLLQRAGYQVTPVSTITEAQALLTSASDSDSQFDLYILDYLLEDGAGTSLCQQIRTMDAHVPIVFVSGAVQNKDKQQAKDAGANAFIKKPVELQTLLDTVAELMQG